MLSNELKEQLMDAGLTKQQATSATAEAVANALMSADEKTLVAEAKHQVEEMRGIFNELRENYFTLRDEISDVSKMLLAIADAQSKHGAVTDEKARNVIALYAALLEMNEEAHGSPTEAINNAGYIVYAYLGGQARRENTTIIKKDSND